MEFMYLLYLVLVSFGILAGYLLALIFPSGKKKKISNALDRLSREIVLLEDIDKMSEKIKEILKEQLDAIDVSVILYDDVDSTYKYADDENKKDTDFIGFYPFFYYLEMNDKIVSINQLLHDTSLERDVVEAARNYFKKVQSKLAVPLIFERRLIGIVNLGRKKEGREYSLPDIEFLSTLRSEITISFTNSLLIRRMSKLFEEVDDQNSKLKKMNQLQSSFVEGISFELLNPIESMRSSVADILHDHDQKHKKDRLVLLRTNLDRLELLVHTLLMYSKIESGSLRINTSKESLGYLVRKCVKEVEPVAEKKHLSIDTAVNDVMAMIDCDKMWIAILNLLDNAVKFTDKGTISIHLSDATGKIIFKVTDTGIGIPKDKQDSLFDTYLQSQEKNSSARGLGLFVAKSIIEMHSGKVFLESSLGEGTTIGFELEKS